MKRIFSFALLFLAVATFAACGDHHDDGHHDDGDHGHEDGGHGHEDGDDHGHGERHEVGKADIGGLSVTVAVFGEIEAGHEAVLYVEVEGGKVTAVRAWVGIDSGKGSMKTKLDVEGDDFHGHAETPDPLPEGAAIWIEVEGEDGKRHKASFPIS